MQLCKLSSSRVSPFCHKPQRKKKIVVVYHTIFQGIWFAMQSEPVEQQKETKIRKFIEKNGKREKIQPEVEWKNPKRRRLSASASLLHKIPNQWRC